jgi:hypothetical protein
MVTLSSILRIIYMRDAGHIHFGPLSRTINDQDLAKGRLMSQAQVALLCTQNGKSVDTEFSPLLIFVQAFLFDTIQLSDRSCIEFAHSIINSPRVAVNGRQDVLRDRCSRPGSKNCVTKSNLDLKPGPSPWFSSAGRHLPLLLDAVGINPASNETS